MKKLGRKFKNKMTKKRLIILIVVILVLSSIGFVKSRAASKMPEIATFEAQVTKGTIEESMNKTGTIESAVFKEVRTNKNGVVENVFVSDDQNVFKGEKIIQINYDEGNGSLSQSNYNLLQLKKEYSNFIEEGEKYNVKAPIAGVLTDVKVKVGDDVTIGTEIARLVDKSTMKATFQFTQNHLKDIKEGDTAEIYISKYLTKINGVVKSVAETGYGLEIGAIVHDVEIEFKNPGALTEGVEVSAKIITNDNKVIPAVKNTTAIWNSDKMILSEVSGEILSVNYKTNQNVTAMNVIAVVDNTDYLDTLKMKKTNLNITQESYEENKKRFDDNIYAPVDGTIIDLNVVSGENINADTIIANVVDLENFQVTIPVDELYILKVKKGQKATIKINAIEDAVFDGVIKKVFQVGKAQNGNVDYNVVIALQKHEEFANIRIGMNAKIKIILDSSENILQVPNEFVQLLEDKYIVSVKKENGEIEEVEVELGLASSDFVEVEGNLKEGDTVIK